MQERSAMESGRCFSAPHVSVISLARRDELQPCYLGVCVLLAVGSSSLIAAFLTQMEAHQYKDTDSLVCVANLLSITKLYKAGIDSAIHRIVY